MSDVGLAEQKALLVRQTESISRLIEKQDDAMPSSDVRKRTKNWLKARWETECKLAKLNKEPNPEYPKELKKLDPENTRIDVIESSLNSLQSTVQGLADKLEKFFNEPVTPTLPAKKKKG